MWCFTAKLTAAGFLLAYVFMFKGIHGHEHGNGPDVVTVIAKQGSDVILPCSLSTMESITSKVFDWKKDGRQEVFLYSAGFHYNNRPAGQDEQFKGRVSHFPEGLNSGNASIRIQNTKMEDGGVYTCVFPLLQPRQTFQIKLVVGPDVVTVIAKQGSDVILPCSLSTMESITSKVFDWKKDGRQKVFFYDAGIHHNNGHPGQDEQFKGRVSHFLEGLKSGNASIMIQNTKIEDGGVYSCDFPRLQPRQLFHIKLVVERTFKDRSGEITGAAAKPYVKIVDQTADWSLLQCEVQDASPKPELRWEDKAGNILHANETKVTERGGRYDIILNITVNKTDMYRCVATQEEISHKIDTETFVFISDKQFEDECSRAAWMTGGLFIGVITVPAAWILFKVAEYIIKRQEKDPPQTNGFYTSTSKEPDDSPA